MKKFAIIFYYRLAMDFVNSNKKKFLITTSRNPDHFLRRTSKVLSLSIPKSKKINRGSLNKKSLFSYCLNQRILRLIILQNTIHKLEALIKIFSIDEKVHDLTFDSVVKLSNIIEINKHDKQSSFMIDKINMKFSLNVDKYTKKKIINFFSPIIKNSNDKNHLKLLTIDFRQINPTKLVGEAFACSFSSPVLLYKINIEKKCDDNRVWKI